jgi:hypothetical protein
MQFGFGKSILSPLSKADNKYKHPGNGLLRRLYHKVPSTKEVGLIHHDGFHRFGLRATGMAEAEAKQYA